MLLRDRILSLQRGVFKVQFLNDSDQEIGSGSSFWSAGYLITNNHVFIAPESATKVRIQNAELKEDISLDVWRSSLKSGSTEQNHDFAILELPDLVKFQPHSCEMKSHSGVLPGDDVFLLGFPFGSKSLVAHKGIISSKFTSNGVSQIQVDASVNASNSGGPLIDISDGQVIGIVTRKATGLTRAFSDMKKLLDDDIDYMGSLSGVKESAGKQKGISLGGQAYKTSVRLKSALAEIERSANVGIGYAFAIDEIKDEIQNLRGY